MSLGDLNSMKRIFKTLKKNKFPLIILGAVLLIGIYLRIGGVFTGSFAFIYDVGRDMLQVAQIVNEHKVPLIGQTTGLGGLYYGPWWYYILTPSFMLSGGNPQGVALFMVLIGVITIILGYLYGSIVGGKWLTIIIATLLSFSSVMVGLASQIWNPNIAPPLIILLFVVFALKYKDEKKLFLLNVCTGLLLGLIMDAEIVFGVLIIASAAITYAFLRRKKLFSVSILGLVAGFLFILLPRIFFELRHGFIMTKSLFSMHGGDQRIFDPTHFFIVLPDRLTTLLNQFAETFGISSVLGLALLIGSFVVLYVSRKNIKPLERQGIMMCLIIAIVFICGSSIFARAIWGHYLVGLPVVYIIFVSIVVVALMRKHVIFGVILFLILSLTSIRPDGIIANIQNPNWEGNAAVYRNQTAVVDYVYKKANMKKFNYTAYTPVVHDYTYQYLFSWYGENKYGYKPSTEAQKLLYVVIEPDPGYEGRIKDWLKVRDGDGKIIGEEVVKGGIRVQTRNR